ncbi:MAG TPA: alpha/beta hydrolase, partial [Acidimicrobiia bacterium]|nr:alpha/beta hydrolase [Acidimicrobiia bacterium]
LAPPTGRPPSVVFIHGLFIDNLSSLYYSLANPVAQAGADAILYDLRGHGRSEQTPAGYTLDDSVEDLLAVVDALGVGAPVHLVGHSYGASVALRAGLRHPERLAGLTLIEPHCADTGDGGSWVEDVADALTAIALCSETLALPADEEVSPSTVRKLRALKTTNAFLNATTMIEDVAASPRFTGKELAGLEVPTMAVYGEQTDLASSLAMIRASMPQCRLEVFPGVGHSVLRDATPKVLALLIDWLAECSDPELEWAAS